MYYYSGMHFFTYARLNEIYNRRQDVLQLIQHWSKYYDIKDRGANESE
jgi:hypothetical protein